MFLSNLINKRISLVFLFPLFLGMLTVFTFQPFNLTFLNFLIFPCLFAILVYVEKKSKSKYRKKPYLINLFYVGYFFGVGFFLTGTYWISHSLTFDSDLNYLIPLSLVLIPLCLGLFYGVSTIIAGPFLKNNFSSILLFCATFSFLDYLRAKLFTGFPWNLWAYSWSWFVEILQILNPIGLFAFNLLTLTIFCSPLLILYRKNNTNLSIFFILILLFFSNYIYGSFSINKNTKFINNLAQNENDLTSIKIVSPNFDLNYNLSQSQLNNQISKIIKFSEPEKNKKTLFIWPEGVFGGYSYSEVKEIKSIFQKNFSKNHTVIFGINLKNEYAKEESYFNSLIAVNNNFEIIYKYNKRKLVPFGEFLPFEDFFNNIGLQKISRGYGSFSKGTKQQNLIIYDYKILPLICYEIIFPEITQNKNNEVNFILNISEDGWFGGTIGPYQHFTKAIFRAIESNTYLLRSANKGISAFINNKGISIKRLEPYESGNIELKVPLIQNNYKNKNDLIFFLLLFTYTVIFLTLKNRFK
tara:strand:- start:8 stop:1585 length:1578 start_codon:yes stop_codon:yes gene_type:complete